MPRPDKRSFSAFALTAEFLKRNPASFNNVIEGSNRQLLASVVRDDDLPTSDWVAPFLMAAPLGH